MFYIVLEWWTDNTNFFLEKNSTAYFSYLPQAVRVQAKQISKKVRIIIHTDICISSDHLHKLACSA